MASVYLVIPTVLKCTQDKIKMKQGKWELEIKVCMNLMQSLLDHGRTFFVDNFYTSYELARSLLKRKTHLVGTLRANRKHLPKVVIRDVEAEAEAGSGSGGSGLFLWKRKRKRKREKFHRFRFHIGGRMEREKKLALLSFVEERIGEHKH